MVLLQVSSDEHKQCLKVIEDNVEIFNEIVGKIEAAYELQLHDLLDPWIDSLPLLNETAEKVTNLAIVSLDQQEGDFALVQQSVLNWKESHRFSPIHGTISTAPNFDDVNRLSAKVKPQQKTHYGRTIQFLVQLARRFTKELGSASIRLLQHLEKYSDVITTLESIAATNDLSKIPDCEDMQKEAKRMLDRLNSERRKLVTLCGLIVYQEPPCVVRHSGTSTTKEFNRLSRIPFKVEIRACTIDRNILPPESQIEAIVLSDSQAKRFLEDGNRSYDEWVHKRGSLNNSKARLTPKDTSDEQGYQYLCAEFPNLRITKLGSAESGADTAHEQYHLIFRVIDYPTRHEQNQNQSELMFWTASLPFSLVLNGAKQEMRRSALSICMRTCAINAKTSLVENFNEDVPIPVQKLFASINAWFKTTAGTDRSLEDDKDYLTNRLTRKEGGSTSYHYFYNEKASYWKWFYPAADYIFKWPNQWNDSLLWGFGTKEQISNALTLTANQSVINQSAMIGFSHQYPGSFVVSYFSPDPKYHPLNIKDVATSGSIRNLAALLQSIQALRDIKIIFPANKPIRHLSLTSTNQFELPSTSRRKREQSTLADREAEAFESSDNDFYHNQIQPSDMGQIQGGQYVAQNNAIFATDPQIPCSKHPVPAETQYRMNGALPTDPSNKTVPVGQSYASPNFFHPNEYRNGHNSDWNSYTSLGPIGTAPTIVYDVSVTGCNNMGMASGQRAMPTQDTANGAAQSSCHATTADSDQQLIATTHGASTGLSQVPNGTIEGEDACSLTPLQDGVPWQTLTAIQNGHTVSSQPFEYARVGHQQESQAKEAAFESWFLDDSLPVQ